MNGKKSALIFVISLVVLLFLTLSVIMTQEVHRMKPADILEDDDLMHAFGADKYQPKPFETFTVDVPARIIYEHILFMAMTMDGLIWNWRPKADKWDALRKILQINQNFSNLTFVVADTRNDTFNILDDKALIYGRCDQHTESKCECASKYDIEIFPGSNCLNPSAICTVTVKGRNVECLKKHSGCKAGQFRGKSRPDITHQQPRNTQLQRAQIHSFQRHSNNHNIPTHSVAKTARSEVHHEYLHSDMALSIRMYTLKELANPDYCNIDSIYRGPFHDVTSEPVFSSMYCTEQSCKLAIKCGQFHEPPMSIDSAVKVTLDYKDPFTGITSEITCTALVCNSLAKKEPLVPFILFSNHKHFSIFDKAWGFFIDMCTEVNHGKKPIFKLIRSDCATFWHNMCLKCNGFDHNIYLHKFYTFLDRHEELMLQIDIINNKIQSLTIDIEDYQLLVDEETEKIDVINQKLQQLLQTLPLNKYLFCKRHVQTDINNHFIYADKALSRQGELRDICISFSNKTMYEIRASLRWGFNQDAMNFYNIVLRIPSFNMLNRQDVFSFCISWREIMHLPYEPVVEPIYMQFKYDQSTEMYSTCLFDKEQNKNVFQIGINVQQNRITMTLPGFNVYRQIVSKKQIDLTQVPNILQHLPAAQYMNKTKFKHLPLVSRLCTAEVETETSQPSEGEFNILKNFDFPEALRADLTLFKIHETQKNKYGRYLTELQVEYTRQKRKEHKARKDDVSKKCRDRGEWKLYAMFNDCLKYCWKYERDSIVGYFDKYWDTLMLDVDFSFTVIHVGKLKNKGRLPVKLFWRNTVKKWMIYEMNLAKLRNQQMLTTYEAEQNDQ
eukprot:396221_1